MKKLAVVGMGCLFPGGKTPEEFYQSLLEQKPLMSDADAFSVSFDDFEVPVDKEALSRLEDGFLYTHYIVHEALRTSGYLHDTDTLSRTGMIMGSRESFCQEIFNLFGPAYYAELEAIIRELIDAPGFELDRTLASKSGSPLNIFNFSYPTLLAARTFNIAGPAFAFDGACASSLYSIRLAAGYLESGQADMMLAGGLFFGLRNEAVPAYLESLDVAAKPGQCKPLDKHSGGMVPSEGGGVLVLKRLEDALRDKDRIEAVIEGVGWSNSGRGKQILAPSLEGQQLAYENAFSKDQEHTLSPGDIDYIETHATGTQVGDAVELESLENYYLAANTDKISKPLFGALKGNIGHSLTASGIASLVKVITSMKAGVIPGSYGINEPMSSPQGYFGADNLVTDNVDWPGKASQSQIDRAPRRAAISAFGFGGSNAHLLISQYSANEHTQLAPSSASALLTSQGLSVVGLGAQMGDLQGVKAVSDALYYGKTPGARNTTKRLNAIDKNLDLRPGFLPDDCFGANYYFPAFEFDYIRNSVQPGEESEAVNKELILLKVASEALEDAGFERGKRNNVAVIVAARQNLSQLKMALNFYMPELIRASLAHSGIKMDEAQNDALIKLCADAVMSPGVGFDLVATTIGPIIANRISSLWDFVGPSIKLCSLEHSFSQSLSVAELLLQSADLDAVVVASIDSDPVLESRIWQQKYGPDYGLKSSGAAFGESAVAMVLKRPEQVSSEHSHAYAEITAITPASYAVNSNGNNSFAEFYDKLQMHAGQPAEQGAYIEWVGDLSKQRLWNCLGTLDKTLDSGHCSGAAALNFGQSIHMGEANSVLKAVLMCNAAFKPRALKPPAHPLPAWAFANLELQESSSFWLNTEPPRQIEIFNAGFTDSFTHLKVQQANIDDDAEQVADRSIFQKQDPLFLISAATLNELRGSLSEFASRLHENADLLQLKYRQLHTAQQHRAEEKQPLVAVIVGNNSNEIRSEVAALQAAVAKHIESASSTPSLVWNGSHGSFFTSEPLAREGGVCLCYPPSGINTPNAVYELVSSVPEINRFLAKTLRDADPKVQAALTDLDRQYRSKQDIPIFMDVLVGGLCSELIHGVIGLQPDAYIGLSFGELLMSSVTDVYSEEEGANFIFDLVAPLIAKLSDAQFLADYYDDPELQWMTFFCKGNPQRIAGLLEWIEPQEKVHLSIYASPSNIMISGAREACEAAAAKFGCLAFPIGENIFVHTPPAMEYFEEIRKSNLAHPYWINAPKKAKYYKTFTQETFNYEKEEYAENVANAICRTVDFRGVLRQAHKDGARVFIGMDGGDMCESWIRENLQDQACEVLSISQRNASLKQSIYNLCAKLLSHGVNMDLLRIHGMDEADLPAIEASANTRIRKMRSMVRTISNEPPTPRELILSEANREIFRKQAAAQHTPEQQPLDQQALNQQFPNQQFPNQQFPNQLQPEAERIASVVDFAGRQSASPNALPLALRSAQTSLAAQAANIQAPRGSAAMLRQLFEQNLQVQQAYLASQAQFAQLLANGLTQQSSGATGNIAASFYADVPAQPTYNPDNIVALGSLPSLTNPAPTSSTPTLYTPTSSASLAAQTPDKAAQRQIIWDEATVRELTLGKVANVWGEAYRAADDYPVRVRLPAPPFMFVSRVIGFQAEFGKLQPSMIETEFDIPLDAWYLSRGHVPGSIASESSHSGILLMSFIGVDEMFDGQLRFRAIDSSFTPHQERFLRAGETCRGVFHLDSVMQNKRAVLISYTYDLYDADNVHMFTLKAMSGLFTEEDLALQAEKSKGIQLGKLRKTIKESAITLTLPLSTDKTSFSSEDLEQLQIGRDDLCFGPGYPHYQIGEQLYPEQFRVLTRVTRLDLRGGDYGLGYLEGEADIYPHHWVFDAHFPNDPVLPATFSVEGAIQLLVFFMHASGLKGIAGEHAERAMPPGVTSKLSFRGEVKPDAGTIRYEATIIDLCGDKEPGLMADIHIFNGDKLLTVINNIGIKFKPEAGS